MKKKNKPALMEYLWILVSCISIGFAIYATINKDLKNTLMFLILTGVSILIFFWRRRLRKNNP